MRSVHPQRIPQRPGIQFIILRPAGCLPLPIRLRRLGMHGIDRHPAGQQLFHRGALTRFNRHTQRRILPNLFPPLLPSRSAMREPEPGHHLALPIHNVRVVMILRPIQPGEVSEFTIVFHTCLSWHRRLAARRAGIGTLAGCCSLRRCGHSRRVGRCSQLEPRRLSHR